MMSKLYIQYLIGKEAEKIYQILVQCEMQNTKYLIDNETGHKFFYMGPKCYYGFINKDTTVFRIIMNVDDNYYIQIPAERNEFIRAFLADIPQGIFLLKMFHLILPYVVRYQKIFFNNFGGITQ